MRDNERGALARAGLGAHMGQEQMKVTRRELFQGGRLLRLDQQEVFNGPEEVEPHHAGDECEYNGSGG